MLTEGQVIGNIQQNAGKNNMTSQEVIIFVSTIIMSVIVGTLLGKLLNKIWP